MRARLYRLVGGPINALGQVWPFAVLGVLAGAAALLGRLLKPALQQRVRRLIAVKSRLEIETARKRTPVDTLALDCLTERRHPDAEGLRHVAAGQHSLTGQVAFNQDLAVSCPSFKTILVLAKIESEMRSGDRHQARRHSLWFWSGGRAWRPIGWALGPSCRTPIISRTQRRPSTTWAALCQASDALGCAQLQVRAKRPPSENQKLVRDGTAV